MNLKLNRKGRGKRNYWLRKKLKERNKRLSLKREDMQKFSKFRRQKQKEKDRLLLMRPFVQTIISKSGSRSNN
jgi:hypothetical protein